MTSQVNVANEFDPLEEVIVGIADHSMLPCEDRRLMERTMPSTYLDWFVPNKPFPPELVAKACEQLDNFAMILQQLGVTVRRPKPIDWSIPRPSPSGPTVNGYTSSMVRDALFAVGDKIIEAPMMFVSRKNEYLTYEDLYAHYNSFDKPGSSPTVIRRPTYEDTVNLIDGGEHHGSFIVNNERPAFDAADFLRINKTTIVGQYSNVTNAKGIEWFREQVKPLGVEIIILPTNDPQGMHIDATIMPLRDGLMLYHEGKIDPKVLAEYECFKGWEIIPAPVPKHVPYPPRFMTSDWINMNILVLDGHRVFIEADDDDMCELLEKHGMLPIRVPFKYVNCLGGSFHCATVDIRRGPPKQTDDGSVVAGA